MAEARSPSFSPDAVDQRLREVSRLAGSLLPQDRLATKIDLSGAAVAARLKEASDLLSLCRKLGMADPRIDEGMTKDCEGGSFSDVTDSLIRRAITEKKLLRFSLDGGARIAEPHDYGVRKGKVQLLVFQVSGASRSGRLPDWRWVDLSRATDFAVLEQSFPGRQMTLSENRVTWEQLFLRVDSPSP
jgi:hypothetical protein